MARDDEDDDYDDDVPVKRRGGGGEPNKKVAAGVLGILLGAWGIHKFYLGYTKAGIIQIAATIFTCGLAGVIGLVEGIMYLTKSDEEFYQTYQAGKKEWF
jgi:TM2 domain-containing membrane protein YozV